MITMSPDEASKLTPEEILKIYYQTGSIYIKNNPMTLDELALMYGTDKSSAGHNYCKYYEMLFRWATPHMPNVLEIGIDKGNSLKVWAKYFEGGIIHGIDIRGDYDYLKEWARENWLCMETHVVDHSNKADLIAFGEQHDQYFDIIIEDGSHQSADSILTFETLFPYLKSGGFYAIEDMLCDYDNRWNKGASSLNRVKQMVGEVNMNGLVSNDAICANKIDAVKKYSGTHFENNIEFILVSMGLCIIKKI
jgi:hypothetical protein